MLSLEQIILIWVLLAFILYIIFFVIFIKLTQSKSVEQKTKNSNKKLKMQFNQKRLKHDPNVILTEVFRYGNIKITISNGSYLVENNTDKLLQVYSSLTLPKKYKDILEEFSSITQSKNLTNRNGSTNIYKDGDKTFYTSEA